MWAWFGVWVLGRGCRDCEVQARESLGCVEQAMGRRMEVQGALGGLSRNRGAGTGDDRQGCPGHLLAGHSA